MEVSFANWKFSSLLKVLPLFVPLLMLAGCASLRPIDQELRKSSENGLPVDVKGFKSSHSKVLVEEILSADVQIEPEPHSEVPIEINANVQKWIDYFSLKGRIRFRSFLERGLYYDGVVKEILKEYGVPEELYYLAMIESGYVTHARSPANAVGAWQFIKTTGRRYGLTTNQDLDERRDIIRSTRAAAKHLKDLHDKFGSWYLALAGYNAGEGRIRSAIRRGKTNDFWTLVKMRRLPRETMNYVPKFLAAVIIGQNPEKYGFEDLNAKKFPKVEKAQIPSLVHLREVSKQTGLRYDEIAEINPHLIRQVTPRHLPYYEIWIPEGNAKEIEAIANRLTRYPLKEVRTARHHAPSKHRPIRTHRVRRGETLISIAQRYRVGVVDLKRMNRLKSSRIYSGQTLEVLVKRI